MKYLKSILSTLKEVDYKNLLSIQNYRDRSISVKFLSVFVIFINILNIFFTSLLFIPIVLLYTLALFLPYKPWVVINLILIVFILAI